MEAISYSWRCSSERQLGLVDHKIDYFMYINQKEIQNRDKYVVINFGQLGV